MRTAIITAITALSMFMGAHIATAEVHAPLTCTDAPEYMPYGACDTGSVELTEAEAERVSYCTDGLPVYRDTVTGNLFGDQDGNGLLDGTDCDWS